MVFEGNYLREHITSGYAATMDSAHGVTADTAYTIVSEGQPGPYVLLAVRTVVAAVACHARVHGQSRPVTGQMVGSYSRCSRVAMKFAVTRRSGLSQRPTTMTLTATASTRHTAKSAECAWIRWSGCHRGSARALNFFGGANL